MLLNIDFSKSIFKIEMIAIMKSFMKNY